MPFLSASARGFFPIAAIVIFLLLSGNASAAPVADFSASTLHPCINQSVTFTSTSSGSITSYQWNFGTNASPATSTSAGPVTVTYSTAGSKTITLIVTAADGSDTLIRTNYITVYSSAPVMSGTINGPATVCPNATLISYNINAIANAASYLWTAPAGASIASGNGTPSIQASFGNSGGNICVTASNGCGSSTANCKNIAVGADAVRIMTYNLLNYPDAGSLTADTSNRHPHFRTIIAASDPDILAVQEIGSQSGVNMFLSNVMNANGNQYAAGTFIDGFDSDNGIFFKSSKFSFVSNTRYRTTLRDINRFTLVHLLSGDTVHIFSVHLKASAGSAEEAQRASEVDTLRKYTNALPAGTKFIVLGDFNIYRSGESAYQKLVMVTPGVEGHFIDPINITGTWNNIAYAQYHTQSTRTRAFNGGSTGGLDDRFDMILYSSAIAQGTSIAYAANSLVEFGNDGNHYGDSINRQPNTAVAANVADALHYAADHLPVFATFVFNNSSCAFADLSIDSIIAPANNSCGQLQQAVTLRVRNNSAIGIDLSSQPLSITYNLTRPDNSVNSFTNVFTSGILSGQQTLNLTSNSTFDLSTAGAYQLSATLSLQGDTITNNNSISRSVTTYPNASPVLAVNGPVSFCDGGSVLLRADTSSGITYQWQRNQQNIPGATSAFYTADQSGSFRCVQTKTNTVNLTYPTATFSNNNSVLIPDNSCTAGISTINVSGYNGAVSSSGISIRINVDHNYIGDLVLYLEAPNGDRLGLSNRTNNTTNSENDFINTVFSDNGSGIIPVTGAPYTGTYRPWNSLFTVCTISTTKTSFATIGNGTIVPNGQWRLYAYDRRSTTSGTILNWHITFPSYTAASTIICDPYPSQAITVTEFANPVVTINPPTTSICTNGSIILTASGGVSYSWSPSAGLNTTSGATVTATVTAPITYTVNVTDANGCTGSAVKSLSVNTPPVVTLTTPQMTCINSGTITLNGGNPAGGVYSGPGVSGNVFNPLTAGAGTHSIVYTYTDANGCTVSASSSITVYSLPLASITPPGPINLCQGSTVTLSASGGTSYQWSTGETTSTIQVTTAGNYSVSVFNLAGCSSTSPTVNVSVSSFQMSGTVFNETMGTPSATTPISSYYSSGGFDNDALVIYGSGDVRNTSPSAGGTAGTYTGASGGGNIFITSTAGRNFVIGGINTAGLSGLQLSFGVFKSTTTSNGSDFLVQVSTDSINYTTLNYGGMPSGSGTAVWSNRTITSGIPAAPRIFFQFINTGTTTQYRIDDIILRYTISSPSITASGPTSFCNGGSVILTSTPAQSYLWNTGETTRSITATSTGLRYCNVTGDNGCVSSTNAINVTAQPVAYTMTGGGIACSNGGGVPVGLSGSNVGVSYQLLRNSLSTGSPLAGTGLALNFGTQTLSGNYSVVATHNTLLCSATMSGQAIVTINPAQNYYFDSDGDGYGDPATLVQTCSPANGYVITGGDCNDANAAIHPGLAEICSNNIDDNCNGQTDEQCTPILNVIVYLEGFYEGSQMRNVANPIISDTITISLASDTGTKSIIHSVVTPVDASGHASATFPASAQGQQFYLVIDHRQSLQTWSAVPFTFTPGMTIDMTQNINAAYGSNLSDLGNGKFAVITGDLNRDGIVSQLDLDYFEQNVSLFITGYSLFDLNGDGITESADFSLLENNIGNVQLRP